MLKSTFLFSPKEWGTGGLDYCLTFVSHQLNLSTPLSFLFISQEWSFITEMYSILAKRGFNFVKKNHARDGWVCFNHYCFCSVHTLGFMVKMWVCQERKLQQEICWKHIHFCLRNGKNTEKFHTVIALTWVLNVIVWLMSKSPS